MNLCKQVSEQKGVHPVMLRRMESKLYRASRVPGLQSRASLVVTYARHLQMTLLRGRPRFLQLMHNTYQYKHIMNSIATESI